MDYLLFYWIFSSLFACNYLLDKNASHLLGHHLLMAFVGIIGGWLILPIVLGKIADKILNP